jgi:predicted nucleotidyltransferase
MREANAAESQTLGSGGHKGRADMNATQTLRRHRGEILAIAERHGAEDVRVFGSVARGEAGPDSDIDLLVRFREGTTLLDQAALIRELEAALDSRVDVVSESGLKKRIRERVLQEATRL